LYADPRRFGRLRILAPEDPDLCLLAGDYLYALGLPALLWTLINIELALFGQNIDLSLLPGRLIASAGTFLVVLTIGGALEEPGWRGFALARLQDRLTPVRATLLLGFVWGLWHVPLYGPLGFAFPMILAFFYTFLYNKTGSVLLPILLHASFTPASDNLTLMPHNVHGITDLVIFGTVLAAVWLLVVMAGIRDEPPVSSPWLRAALVAGPAIFLGVGAAGLASGAFLQYRPETAKPAILLIEFTLTCKVNY
jgi:hypothetical protein